MNNYMDYHGVVEKVIEGKHGPYAVVSSRELGSVTLSLTSPVWSEDQHPEPGTYIVFTQVTKKRAGWRAQHGRFFQPSDEKKEQRA